MIERRENHFENEKKRKYEELCEGKPEAIFILSGGIVKIPSSIEKVRYKQGSYADLDNHNLLSGGKARSLAGAELGAYFPDALLYVNSRVKEDEPTHAEVMSEELQRYGIQKERIFGQSKSTSTFTELIELIKLVTSKKINHIVILTNEFQIPRAKAMLERMDTLKDPAQAWQDKEFQDSLQEFKKMKTKVVFVSAEEILPFRDSRYIKIIEEAKKSTAWSDRITIENKAVSQLERGTYWKKE